MDRIPILRMGPVLLVSIQVDMHDQLALTLQDDLTNAITTHGAKGVLIDISAVSIVDSFMGRMLANIAGIARVLDATTVVVGMQPAVAITLVELGLSLDGVRRGLRLHFEDTGPGIPDLKLALTDGWTSGGGMGLGLPGSKRLVHEFDVQSTPGEGTRVSITRWK